MFKKNLFGLFCVFCLFLGYAQEQDSYQIVQQELDTVCAHFVEQLTIDFDVSQKSGCEFLITQLFNKSRSIPEDSLSYQWNVFNADSTFFFLFEEENPDIFLNHSGNYHITFIVTNGHGCVDTLTKFNVISIDKMPQINFTFTPENALFAEYFGEVEFINLTDIDLLNDSTVLWYWDMGDDYTCVRNASPVHLFSVWGDYHTTFHLKTKNGCKVALTKTVTIEDELFFPDTLSSLSQAFSSVFAVTNLNTHIPQDDPDEFRTNHLYIYNAKGEKIYEQKNYDTYIKNNIIVKGNSSIGATDLASGIYYYSFYYKGKNKMVHYSGSIWVE